ncbi:hypothetical protein HJC23_007051 [Cyclotella cryptica]|uniref:Anaphase-promoting complex subunit 4 WD40 domain-containing protein n=1 Tax=Cyclotella cryptica TaxID=29204 RepID=A0ABD3P922_9STRA|eukprot:CCRYP_016482-RA/>CCRYP_016482-RA protein AED:0.02 eAED:0.02 QI:22/1/1/1/0.5/0.33/3/1350/580
MIICHVKRAAISIQPSRPSLKSKTTTKSTILLPSPLHHTENKMAFPKRKGPKKNNDTKRTRPKFNVDLSGHGGKYEDMDDVTPTLNDEDIESDDDDEGGLHDRREDASDDDEEDEEEEQETVEAKRLRMAREYLSKVQAEESEEEESDEEEDEESEDDGTGGRTVDKVGKRIARDRLRKSGLLQSRFADSILAGVQTMRGTVEKTITMGEESASDETYAKAWLDAKYITYHRGHDLTPTCVALSQDGNMAFSGAKDGSVIRWDVQAGTKVSYVLPTVKNHEINSEECNFKHRNEREILSVAISHDDRYLAVGGRDNCVKIFDVRTLGKTTSAGTKPITKFEGHKKAVTSLCFRNRTLDLYSGSEDRCIRRYDLNAMTYVETLYGHQSPITSIDCANKNRPVSVARDRTVRVWKVEEDSHLVFRPGGDVGSADCVSAIQDGWFITGHEDGRLALWREEKKRPVGDVIVAAHGYEGLTGGVARGVVCCNAWGMSDVLATGSNDGYLRLWKVNTEEKSAGITPLEKIPVHGHINSLAIGPGGKFCVAAVGQEPRMGRWDRVPKAKNRFAIIQLSGVEGSSNSD